jgi:hypothetical protein
MTITAPPPAPTPLRVPRSRRHRLPSGPPTVARLHWALELAVVAALYVVYDASRDLHRGRPAVADADGERILRWERDLGVAPEHWLNQILWHDRVLAVVASYDYATLHFVVTPAVLVWLYRRHPDRYRPARTAIAVATISSLVVFWLLPTTPPRMLPGAGIHDILASVHRWGWWGGDGSVPRGLGSLSNQMAAMPSLHVGWALWSGWSVARHARRPSVRVLGALYPLTTALVVMGTGNHYLLDVVGGALVVAAGAGVAAAWYRRHPVVTALVAATAAAAPVPATTAPAAPPVVPATTAPATAAPLVAVGASGPLRPGGTSVGGAGATGWVGDRCDTGLRPDTSPRRRRRAAGPTRHRCRRAPSTEFALESSNEQTGRQESRPVTG